MTEKTRGKSRGRHGANGNLINGNPGNKGGTGRPSDLFKARCVEFVKKGKILEYLSDVSSGKKIETKVSIDGKVVMVPCDTKDRLRASEMLLDRAYGKPSMSEDDKDTMGVGLSMLAQVLQDSRKERGLND